jgi:hypothetical protein
MDHRDRIVIPLLAALVLAVFWRAVLGGIFYLGNILQLQYPLRSAYAAELARGSLPLWTPLVVGGYPLLAEGSLGALYPPNWILHTLLPVAIALNVFVLAHLLWAALGAYAFARRLGGHQAAAFASALAFALGGFLVAHLTGVNIIACAAWLPWLFLLVDRVAVDAPSGHPARDAALLALALGMAFLAGQPQIALLGLLAVLAYALYLSWATRQHGRVIGLWVVALLLGVGLAAAQLLPSHELAQLSMPAGGADSESLTASSLDPRNLVSLVSPFISGTPDPGTSGGWVGYVGLLPLLLALLAPFLAPPRADVSRPVRPARFLAGLAVVAVLFAFGRYNPVYMALLRLPVFGLLRVPGYFLYLFSFAAAILAGMGLEAMLTRGHRVADATESGRDWLGIAAVALVAVAVTASLSQVDAWASIWRWLPAVLGLLGLAWLAWAWRSKGSSYAVLAVLALALIVGDLLAFNAVYNLTSNQTMPLQEFTAQPRSLPFLQSQTGVYRIYTQEKTAPSPSALRESYYPNLALTYGLPTANGLLPLVPPRYARYTSEMTGNMLNLLGVKYYLIPQAMPAGETGESYDLDDPFAYNPVERTSISDVILIAAFEVDSYLTNSADVPNGELVALISVLPGELDEVMDFKLVAGGQTAEWAYDRSDIRPVVRHGKPASAREFPARSGFPPEEHPGYVYHASYTLPYSILTQGITVFAHAPLTDLHIERIALIDEQGERHVIAHMQGSSDHSLVYLSGDVAIFQNNDVLPRIFLTYAARAVPDDEEALAILRTREFDPRHEVLLAAEQAAATQTPTKGSERVELTSYDARRVVASVVAPADSYLVLTDAWYPGWKVRVDGQEAALLRADVLFRAVHLTAGEHTVEFTYAPASFRTGLIISAAALLLVLGLFVWGRRKRGVA